MIFKQRQKKSDVEIIVLCQNNLPVTQKFIKALYKSTREFNVIFVDNGSNDKTPEFLKQCANQLQNITLVLNDDNLGVIGGRNQGFEIISSFKDKPDYISFLDNDQFVEPEWLEHHLSVLQHGYDLVGVEAWQMNNSYFPTHKNSKVTEWYSYVGCGGMLMKLDVPLDLGMFDERFNPAYFEDPDFNFRALDNGYEIGWNVKAKLTHLPHQTLGNAPDKAQRFANIYKKFREKWKNRVIPRCYQVNLPEFAK